jgi:transcriptional regulator with PAS, ATPase and Fis domain
VFALIVDGRGHPAPASDPVVGPELSRVYAQVQAHAAEDTLLVHGESGSGKELAARLYHHAGPRRSGPFIAVNCATIPEGVAERLLFGSKKGAFSGAIDAAGHFQMANGGTLFLDEVAELDPAVQAKVLRVLETREVTPVGSSTRVPLSLGIVAASHHELRDAVAERRFREDLYYRIAGATIHLPPLRERKVDIARLVERELRALGPAFSAHAKLVEACCVRTWPGNIRELRAAVRQAATSARIEGRTVVRAEDLAATAGMPITVDKAAMELRVEPAELDRETIVAALTRANGVISNAARSLGLHRTQLYRLIERHAIERDE